MTYKKIIILSTFSFLLASCAEQNEYQQQLLNEYPSVPANSSAKKGQVDAQAFSNYLRCKENKNRAELQSSFVSIAALLGAFATHGAGTYNPEQPNKIEQDCQFPSS